MKERPILFSGEMVRAILAEAKTQTRRVVKTPKGFDWGESVQTIHDAYRAEMSIDKSECGFLCAGDQGYELIKNPYGKPGDRLWVREAHYLSGPGSHPNWDIEFVLYRADNEGIGPLDGCVVGKKMRPPIRFTGRMGAVWRPSIHMPRWASRITLEITGIRIERVQEISDKDALAEGVNKTNSSIPGYPKQRFAQLWEGINDRRGYGWNTNPWVWVIEFRRTGSGTPEEMIERIDEVLGDERE